VAHVAREPRRKIAALNYFVVATVSFRWLYCFIVLRHDHRWVAHCSVTAHPTGRWTAQQVIEAFPFDTSPRFLIRNRDALYGEDFRRRRAWFCVRFVHTENAAYAGCESVL
jgi:hypothetical protein